MNKQKCVHCRASVSELTKMSEGGGTVRHAICPFCKEVADIYAINKTALPRDLFMFKPEAFTHLVFNLPGGSFRKVLAWRALLVLINTLDRAASPGPAEIGRAILPQLLEIFLQCAIMHRFVGYQKTLFVTTALSALSLLKVLIFFTFIPIRNIYYQMCNILILLMTSKALSTFFKRETKSFLSYIVTLRVISTGLFYFDFQI
ncbi:uncharacterized protein NEMAJ01_0697 [Nematocida major]|uniref:uncharacterized protein n=1 Tax=Nematocida major TaxID=1912982 RepID=UPI00200744D8|nr:uncharacterized protein NEMAJ01_0697 [Nematocida major]KAH9385801.1 hypothetical protein NEMAJ01_0697 [Nematocida major]